jgi:S1-C subfamily serine protease
MLKRVLLCFLLLISLVSAANPQDKQQATIAAQVPQQDRAETVFANSASKVVYLTTRRLGTLHATASGVILSADGYVGTNYHALQGADTAEVRFFADPTNAADYQSFGTAKLLYANSERDIAILKVNSSTLPFFACPTRTDCEARIGENVYAIGNPKGLSNTISEGIVSGLRADGGEELVQHTAPISPGSSGGALLDSNGNLLGMNSWQVTDAQNLDFAISTKHLLEALEAARHVTTALSFLPQASADATARATPRVIRSPAELVSAAKTLWVSVSSGSPVLKTEISKKLLQWGKLILVSSPSQADLVLEVVQTGELNMSTGAGNQAAALLRDSESGTQLWSTTKGGSWSMSGYSNAWVGRGIGDEFIKFYNSTTKTAKK